MQDKHLFEYAVIRIVPRVEREEFLNVGVVLFSKKEKYLRSRIRLDQNRLKAFSEQVDPLEVDEYLKAFEMICAGDERGGPISKLDPPSRFRWLTATRSTIVQTSKVHPGFCKSHDAMLNRLFEQMVL